MLASLGVPPGGEAWAWEMKWDGFRGVARMAGDRLAIDSRNGKPLAGRYPELVDLPAAVDGRVVTLDGELVVLNADGAPSFERMQRRLDVRPSAEVLAGFPVLYLVFDVLSLDGVPTIGLPYAGRRALLDDLGLRHPHVQVPPSWAGADGDVVRQVARDRHLEGVVAKRLASVYQPGRRSRDWIRPLWPCQTPSLPS